MTQIFKVKNGLSPELINDFFDFIRKSYSLQTDSYFGLKRIRMIEIWFIDTFSFISLKLWNLVPNEHKAITSLLFFKLKVKTGS